MIGKSGWLGFLILGIASYIVYIIFVIYAMFIEENMTNYIIMGCLVCVGGVLLAILNWVGIL